MRHSPFVCQQCEYRSSTWLGRCPECGAWSSLVEEPARREPRKRRTGTPRSASLPFSEIPVADAARTGTGIEELDRVLGGGMVPGMVVLVGGEPGIGKSTLMLQAASTLADRGTPVLYCTGEESPAQLRLRGERLGVRSDRLAVLAETEVELLAGAARDGSAAVLIVDSIQTLRCDELDAMPGSVSQVRESATRLVGLAKSQGIPVFLVGHVTKDGSLAGPRALEHVVDTVLQFEGDRHHAHRILRTIKNRFGPAGELGVFTMHEDGLRGVQHPSELFLSGRPAQAPGSAVLAAIQGNRPLLVEIQALVGEPGQASPRRTAIGVDANRVALILAVLQRRAGLDLATRDVFVNVTGGMSVLEPAADLAVAAAVASSRSGRPIPDRWTVIGEIGLTGEIRAVARLEARLREAGRMGFDRALVPAGAPRPRLEQPVEPVAASHVAQAFEALFAGSPGASRQIG